MEAVNQFDYDVLFIGCGHASFHGAGILNAMGKKVAFAEREVVGGTCTNFGCDAKILLDAPSELISTMNRFKGIGLQGDVSLSWPHYMGYKHALIDPLNGAMEQMFNAGNMPVIKGAAYIQDAHTVRIGSQTVTADKIVIGAGQSPAPLDVEGKEYLHDSKDFLSLPALPAHMTFIGAGIISMEFASLVAQLGIKATVIHHSDRPLRAYSKKYVDRLVAKLSSEGVEFLFNEDVKRIEKTENGYLVTMQSGKQLGTGYVLDAVGRSANVDGMGLENVGIQFSGKGIVVDEFMRANGDNIYASGDVVAKRIPKLTPTAAFESNYIAMNILGDPRPIQYPAIPNMVFTLPRVSQVGVPVEEAERQPDQYKMATLAFGQNYAFLFKNELDAEATVIFDNEKHLVGAEVYGEPAAEMINLMTIIINKKMTGQELNGMIFAFPTAANGLLDFLIPMML